MVVHGNRERWFRWNWLGGSAPGLPGTGEVVPQVVHRAVRSVLFWKNPSSSQSVGSKTTRARGSQKRQPTDRLTEQVS